MARAIIHNSDYQSVEECTSPIDRYYADRNQHFENNPRRAGKQIWGMELVSPVLTSPTTVKTHGSKMGPANRTGVHLISRAGQVRTGAGLPASSMATYTT